MKIALATISCGARGSRFARTVIRHPITVALFHSKVGALIHQRDVKLLLQLWNESMSRWQGCFWTFQDSWYMNSTFYCITCFTLDTCRISKSLGTFWTQTEFYIFSFDIPFALKDQKEIHLITLMQAQYFSNACVLFTYSALHHSRLDLCTNKNKKRLLRMSQGNKITINILSESFERRRKTSGTESLNSWRNTWLVVTFSVFPFEIQSIDVKVSTPWGKRKMEEWDTHLLPFIKLQDAQIFVRQFHTRNESLRNIFSLAKVLFANLKAQSLKSTINGLQSHIGLWSSILIHSHDVITTPKENVCLNNSVSDVLWS